MKTPVRLYRRHGFSLLEMLAVMAIVAILLVLLQTVTPTAALDITSSGQTVSDTLNFGRATALGRNEPVEVRFYQVNSAVSGKPQYRALQLFLINADTNKVPLTKFTTLPTPIIFESANSTYASLLTSKTLPVAGSGPIPGDLGSHSYEGFVFNPNGSTNLDPAPSDTWFVMIRSETDTKQPPKNYCVVQIDPISGRLGIFRP